VSHHDLKSWPEYFRLHCTGELEMSIRKNDRNFCVGDTCRFKEWKPGKGYTGKVSLHYMIRYILMKSEGLKPGYVILMLEGPYGEGNRA
jgi:hypothetical protein